jgi:DNA-binding transcriptional regulator GbsR (MarR family)
MPPDRKLSDEVPSDGVPSDVTGRDEPAVRRFVEHLAMTLSDLGFPRMPARVLVGLMSAEEDALTAADLAHRLGVSPAAISGAVRNLMQLGLVVREPAPGSRRDVYRLSSDTWYEASVTKMWYLKVISDIATEGVVALGGTATPAGRRVDEMREFFVFCLADIEALAERWRAKKAAEATVTEATVTEATVTEATVTEATAGGSVVA